MHASHGRRSRRSRNLLVIAAALTTVLAACGSDDDDSGAETADGTEVDVASTTPDTEATTIPAATEPPSTEPAATEPATTAPASTTPATEPAAPLEGTVNFGFFPNVTHAPALVGIGEGFIPDALGDGVELEPFTFNAGTEAIEALFAGAIDITLIGPNPAINGFAQSDGEALRIVSGSNVRRRLLRRQAGDHVARATRRHDDRHAVARQHPGRRAAGLARRAGIRDHPRGRRRRVDPAAVQLDHARVVPRRLRSTAPGFPSRGRPG